MKKILSLIISMTICTVLFTSCVDKEPEITQYTDFFLDSFDTVTTITSFQSSQEEFDELVAYAHQRFLELHKLYDIYKLYDGVTNIKKINQHASKAPMEVAPEIIDLLLFSKEWREKSDGKINIAMGTVLSAWRDTRNEAIHYMSKTPPRLLDNAELKIPSFDQLSLLAEYTDIDDVIIDEENNTVFLANTHIQLDVGAIAKGFATEILSQELALTYDNFAISAGGNVKTHGIPKDAKRNRWSIGLQNPAINDDYTMVGGTIDTVYVQNSNSIVCSGGYQRNFVYKNRRYHHLIDPETLFPEEYYLGVIVLTEDSGDADALSTAIFFMEVKEALALVENTQGAQCMLILMDGTIITTDGMKDYLKSEGVTANTP